jgi:hypothetical protein
MSLKRSRASKPGVSGRRFNTPDHAVPSRGGRATKEVGEVRTVGNEPKVEPVMFRPAARCWPQARLPERRREAKRAELSWRPAVGFGLGPSRRPYQRAGPGRQPGLRAVPGRQGRRPRGPHGGNVEAEASVTPGTLREDRAVPLNAGAMVSAHAIRAGTEFDQDPSSERRCGRATNCPISAMNRHQRLAQTQGPQVAKPDERANQRGAQACRDHSAPGGGAFCSSPLNLRN